MYKQKIWPKWEAAWSEMLLNHIVFHCYSTVMYSIMWFIQLYKVLIYGKYGQWIIIERWYKITLYGSFYRSVEVIVGYAFLITLKFVEYISMFINAELYKACHAVCALTLTLFVAWERPLHLHLLLLFFSSQCVYILGGIKAREVLVAMVWYRSLSCFHNFDATCWL